MVCEAVVLYKAVVVIMDPHVHRYMLKFNLFGWGQFISAYIYKMSIPIRNSLRIHLELLTTISVSSAAWRLVL